MKTETRITSHTADMIVFGYWDEEADEFVELKSLTKEEQNEVAGLLGCSPVLVDALIMLADTIAEGVAADLKDIWRKVA